MKKIREDYTCDRCGKKIEEIPENVLFRHVFIKLLPRLVNVDIETLATDPWTVADDPDVKKVTDLLRVESLSLNYNYGSKRKHYDLCPECRKAFNEFMGD